MPDYLCLQRNLPNDAASGEAPSPAQMEEMYAQFNTWRERFEAQLIDMGGKLGAGRVVTAEPAADAPLVEIKELAGGYMIVRAASLDEAAEIASGCPGLVGPGSAVEVVEIFRP